MGVVGVVSVVVVGGVVSVSVVGVVSVWVCVSAGWHSRRASWATVDAPWLRLLRSVALTELGRLATALESSLVALDTPLQVARGQLRGQLIELALERIGLVA